MKPSKCNPYLILGLLWASITAAAGRLFHIPELLYGLSLGLAITFEIIGLYAVRHDLSRVRNFKLKMLRKVAEWFNPQKFSRTDHGG